MLDEGTAWQCAIAIVRGEGWMGLFKGAGPAVAKSALTTAVTLGVYEAVLGLLEPKT